MPPRPDPTATEILTEAVDLGTGLTVMLLPLLVTALPGVILILVAPVALLLAVMALPVALAGAVIAPPYLLVRSVRRRLRRAV